MRGKKPESTLFQSKYIGRKLTGLDFFVNWRSMTTLVAPILRPLAAQDSPNKNNKDVRDYT